MPQACGVHCICVHPRFKTLDDAFSNASYGTSLLLISLLRLSPVLPFSWANYIFGLSPVPFTAFSLGTFLGCLPAVAAYVNAGKLGAEIVVSRAPSHAPEPCPEPCPERCPSAAPPIDHALTAHAQINGAESNDALVFVGLLSTIAAISVAGTPALPSLAPRASPRAPAWLGRAAVCVRRHSDLFGRGVWQATLRVKPSRSRGSTSALRVEDAPIRDMHL